MVLAEAAAAGCAVVLYTPNEVKRAVTGSGAAAKTQVQRMVQAILRLEEPPEPPDAADALALAITHHAVAPLAARIEPAQGADHEAASMRAASGATAWWVMARASASAASGGFGGSSRRRMACTMRCTWPLAAAPEPVTARLTSLGV